MQISISITDPGGNPGSILNLEISPDIAKTDDIKSFQNIGYATMYKRRSMRPVTEKSAGMNIS